MPEDITEVVWKKGLFYVGQVLKVTEAEDVYFAGLVIEVREKEIYILVVEQDRLIAVKVINIDAVLDEILQVEILA